MVKYYIGKDKKITSYHYETFVIKNGDKITVEQTYNDNKTLFCNHKKGSGVMLSYGEVGDIKDLRYQKLEYVEKYY